MELRWTQEAAADLERIADYLFEHAPGHAKRLVSARYGATATLLTFPNRGRLVKKEGTRELVMSPLPYVVVYTVREDAVYSFASCTGRSSGRDGLRAMAGNARRQRRHLWQSRQRAFCKLQTLKGLGGFESHPLRQIS